MSASLHALEQPGYTKSEAQRGLGLQVAVALVFGIASLVLFSFWRRRWPQVYAVRSLRKPDLPSLGKSFFGWIPRLLKISDREILLYAGLDSYVYLTFFRAAVTVFWKLSLVSLLLIAPLRWYYSGHLDENYQTSRTADPNGPPPSLLSGYIWVYVPSTYIFTIICLWTMRQYTYEVVSVRQAYLGHQDSITDRTLRISGIPSKLRSENELKQYLTVLFGSRPESIMLCRKWDILDELFSKREKILKRLEKQWAAYIGPDNEVFKMNTFTRDQSTPVTSNFRDADIDDRGDHVFAGTVDSESIWGESMEGNIQVGDVESNNPELGDLKSLCSKLFPNRNRPVGRTRHWGLAGPKVDLIEHYEQQLQIINSEITAERQQANSQSPTSMAFVTMSSVAHCQLAAQALFSPRPHTTVSLAPAPNDIIWKSIYLNSKQRSLYNYMISVVVLITNAFLTVPLTYLARFIDLDTISKLFPTLGDWLSKRKWTATFVTDVLPTYVFSSFNLFVPYFLAWLSKRQGLVSRSDVEVSIISKNFFYVFVNLFLIFTIESTIFSISVDKLAKDFAEWPMRLSSFYTNLIVLQGIGITPFKLLQPGSIFQFPFLASRCKTARDHYNLYKPQKINYGLVLPTPMLLFIVTLTYSILKLKILLFGLIYFGASYFVFKYQLLYTTVHPQHSTAQVWPVINRRVYIGIAVFHLVMVGILVLQSEYVFAVLIVPLSVLLMVVWYDFEKFTKPLLEFVAIESMRQSEIDASHLGTYNVQNNFSHSDRNEASQESIHPTRLAIPPIDRCATDNIAEPVINSELPSQLWNSGIQDQTLDEEREDGLDYVNKSLVDPLDGPWVAANAFEAVVANPDGFHRRRITQAEWL